MTAHRCACGLPAKDATLCPRCLYAVEKALAEIPSLADELDVTTSRQTAVTPQDGGRSAEKPLPYNPNASEVADNLKATLVGWVRDMHDPIDPWPDDDSPSCSRWLFSRLDRIRVHAAADQLHDEVTYAVAEARKAVDRPLNRSRVFVGACLEVSCPGELWARFPLADYDADDPATHASMTCTECEVTYAADQWISIGRRLLRRSA